VVKKGAAAPVDYLSTFATAPQSSGREIRTLMVALIYLEKKGFAHPLTQRYSKRYSNLFCNI